MSNVKVTTLSNGLRVATDAMPEVESATLGIWVACGTRHESAELNGMAHMLEHMAFKGTARRSICSSREVGAALSGMSISSSMEPRAFASRASVAMNS